MSEREKPVWEEGTDVKERPKVKTPKRYKVLLHNDYTTMEFVVHILVDVFREAETEATQIMLHVHTKGEWGRAGYTHTIWPRRRSTR